MARIWQSNTEKLVRNNVSILYEHAEIYRQVMKTDCADICRTTSRMGGAKHSSILIEFDSLPFL